MLSDVMSQGEGVELRLKILKRLKTQVQLYLGKESADLRRYALAYKKNIERTRWTPSSKEELYNSLLSVDIVFGGDFHAFAQAQKAHLRALREIVEKKKVVLAVECIESKYQKVLDQFLAGQISEELFLEKVQWNKSWGFAWGQYKPLFDLMKKTGGRCLALDLRPLKKKDKVLIQRDKHAAQILSGALKSKNSNEVIYVVYGDLHIAKEHLPKLIGDKAKSLIIYLNPEKIYFQLVRKKLEHKVNVIRFSKNEYCLIESPPWVKWQSYLLFLEENIDQALPSDESQMDYTEHVLALFKMMTSDLKIAGHSDFAITSFDNDDFMDLLQDKLSKTDYAFINKLVSSDLGFYYPSERTGFLSRSTVNHAAHLAAQILHAQLCEREKVSYEVPQEFEMLIWIETVAFALSKMINPHRKALSLNDLKKQLAAFSPKDSGEEALKIALGQKMRDLLLVYGRDPVDETYRVKDKISYYKAAKILGGILGDSIYLAYRAGRLSREKWLKWLKHPLEVEDFHIFYIQVLKELDKMDLGDVHG